MKYLLVIAVVGLVLWLMFGKSRRQEQVRQREQGQPRLPAQMVRCDHCGMHLPASEAVSDAAGRAYCGEAHRQAGPRGKG